MKQEFKYKPVEVKTDAHCPCCGHTLLWIGTEATYTDLGIKDEIYFCGTGGCKIVNVTLRFPIEKYPHQEKARPLLTVLELLSRCPTNPN